MTSERRQKTTEWPIMLAALSYLAACSRQVLGGSSAPRGTGLVLQVIWPVFAVHYVVSLVLAPQRVSWFLGHLHEPAIVALPMLRPLRLFGLLTTLSILHRGAGTAATVAHTDQLVAHVDQLRVEISDLRGADVDHSGHADIHSSRSS